MTDERSKTDDVWVDALEGKPADGPDNETFDARVIRAAIEAQDEATEKRVSDEDVEAAKQKLLARLGGATGGGEAADDATPERSKVVDMSARRPAGTRRSIWQQNPGMLLAASVAFVAIVIMVLRNPDLPDGPDLIMSFGEIDTLRGAGDEVVYRVANPDSFGRELGARLTERGIPFVLVADTPDSPERIVTIQVDGVPNSDGVEDTLDELGLAMPSTSVITVRLVPE